MLTAILKEREINHGNLQLSKMFEVRPVFEEHLRYINNVIRFCRQPQLTWHREMLVSGAWYIGQEVVRQTKKWSYLCRVYFAKRIYPLSMRRTCEY